MESEMKVCPDCAESVKRAARVCRYCGFRFEPTDRRLAAQEAGKAATAVASATVLKPFEGRVGGLTDALTVQNEGPEFLKEFEKFLKEQKAHKGFHKEKLGMAAAVAERGSPPIAAA